MKSGFYFRLAFQNLLKNHRFFIPRILSEAGLLACFYIAHTLSTDRRMTGLRGGDYIALFMSMGAAVLAILSVILMLYVNSFLMKQRRREYGVYNILGMEKRHIGRLLFCENLISSLLSIALGLLAGILLYKFSSLLICRLLDTQIVAGFYYITAGTVLHAALSFLVLDGMIFLLNRISIARLKPVELLSSAAVGEREPKVRWLLLLVGLVSLAAGYYISITTTSPLKAVMMFFAAVLLVILGTYCLFVSGSIFILKCLKKNRDYYYRPGHMVTVSGLLYRMKLNAVGLASIAILATGVLVMISTTVSLYMGLETTLTRNYPQQYYVSASCFVQGEEEPRVIPMEDLKTIVRSASEEAGVPIAQMLEYSYLQAAYDCRGSVLSSDRNDTDLSADLSGLCEVTFLTSDALARLGADCPELAEDEIVVFGQFENGACGYSALTIHDRIFRVRLAQTECPVNTNWRASAVSYFEIVVADDAALSWICREQKNAYGQNASRMTYQLAVDFEDSSLPADTGRQFDRAVQAGIRSYMESMGAAQFGLGGTDSRWNASEALFGMYGTLLFLGILLGFVCMFATVLIIYYKQISEGYEDRSRFQIMQKIGMSDREVRSSIRSQVLTVFFLPLVMAGIHLAFAVPILERLLEVLMLPDRMLFITCALVTFGVFALVYMLIYTATSRTYYKIVH